MAHSEIDVDEFARRLDDGVTVVDVRQPAEFEEARIEGALLIPLAELPDRLGELPEGKPLLVVCRSGARSARACEFLGEQGYDSTNVAGGMLAWIDAGREVASGSDGG
jgi:rhodanese-related sulfurtransferase